MSQVRDPVCGMMIDSEKAAGSSAFQGTTFYFCSTGCQEEFNADKAAYAAGRKQQSMGETEPRFTKTGPVVAPKFGAATSGGAEYEPGPARKK